jgi:probable rRNA maturation factor
MQVNVQYAVARAGIPAARTLALWAKTALPVTAKEAQREITIRVVGAAEGRRLNRDYRQRDYATNVLSFTYDQTHGDIVLCAPIVKTEARAAGKTTQAHYAHLVIHGVLHLQGYDHEHEVDARKMEARERTLLAKLGYADPYRDEKCNA